MNDMSERAATYWALVMAFVLVLACAGVLLTARDAQKGALAATGTAQGLAEKIEAGAGPPVYAINWIEYACPGMAGGFIPTGLRPMACPASISVWRTSSRRRAMDKVGALRGAPGLLLLKERGPLEEEIPITWKPETK